LCRWSFDKFPKKSKVIQRKIEKEEYQIQSYKAEAKFTKTLMEVVLDINSS
jgi:hypothetical protein